MDTVYTDLLSLLLFRSNPMHQNTLSACVLVPGTHRYFLANLANVACSSFLAAHQSREGSFRKLLQQLSISFTNVKISKPGELIHLALSITLIVRFVDGNILLPFQ